LVHDVIEVSDLARLIEFGWLVVLAETCVEQLMLEGVHLLPVTYGKQKFPRLQLVGGTTRLHRSQLPCPHNATCFEAVVQFAVFVELNFLAIATVIGSQES
jgi:hypothetical protein